MKDLPAVKGAAFALLAAGLFGASTPLLQRAGAEVGHWLTAALLYAGAATTGLLLRSRGDAEARLRQEHWLRLVLMALFGAVLGPAALAWGLQHTSGTGASLMLTLEAVFTVVLSYLMYREQIDRHVAIAIFLLTMGGVMVVFDRATSGSTQVLGMLAVVAATLSWGMDNTLSRELSHLDPGRVVWGKAAIGAILSSLLAISFSQAKLTLMAGFNLFLIGAVGYGLSLRFFLLAQREFGSARTGSVFATAPFIGAVIAFGFGERGFSGWLAGGALLMGAGVALHMLERHEHEHRHETLKHEHTHSHEDGHHLHRHDAMPTGTHSHEHEHDPMVHSHAHAPDLHHGHTH